MEEETRRDLIRRLMILTGGVYVAPKATRIDKALAQQCPPGEFFSDGECED